MPAFQLSMELGDRPASGIARRRCQLSRAPAGLALGRLKLMTGCGSGSPSIEPEDRRLAGVELTRSLKCSTAALVKGFRTPARHRCERAYGGRRPKSLRGGNRGGVVAGG